MSDTIETPVQPPAAPMPPGAQPPAQPAAPPPPGAQPPAQPAAAPGPNAQARFGTFGGVFTPCVLTILGVIMFMRTGFVVGYAGLWLALVILGVSKLITTLTTFSLSAIATNLKMRGGGPYFMISRVLGPDFGGSIGITLFFAQAVGVAFYVIGFTEAFFSVTTPLLSSLLGDGADVGAWIQLYRLPQIVSSVVVFGLFFLTFKGADVAIRAQYFVLVVLLLGVASFIVGGVLEFDASNLAANRTSTFTSDIGFWTAFAIFFPATTGISAGANMSGDLKNPAKSLPVGTLLAIGFTAVIYATQIVLTSGATPRAELQAAPFESLQAMSVFGPLVLLGVFAATLSSALGSFLGAPRILQAMGQDRLMRVMVFFGKGSGETNEPRRATILTFVLAVGVIWAGDLNAVAQIISMFFLIAYGMINLSAFVESKGANPSFRPRFRFFHWTTGLAGAIGCFVAMMKINDTYALIALGLTGIIYFYLKKRDIHTSYGDAKRGYIFKQTRDNLIHLGEAKPHPKNWRPILVAVTEDPLKEIQLVRVGAWLESGRGLYSVVQLAERPTDDLPAKVRFRADRREDIRRRLDAEGIVAFPEALVTDDVFSGLSAFLQSYSLGGVRPNTVLIAMPPSGDNEGRARFLKKLEIVATFDLSLAVLKPGDIAPNKPKRTIDIWWRGEKNGGLMALFAYLMTLDVAWSGSRIRILRVVQNERDEAKAKGHLKALMNAMRLKAEVCVFRSENVSDVIAEQSGTETDIVLLGLQATSAEEARRSLVATDPLLAKLPTTVLVWSNGEADVLA
jgi:amino acid transporter